MTKIELPSKYGYIAERQFKELLSTDTIKKFTLDWEATQFILQEVVKEILGNDQDTIVLIEENISAIYPKLRGQLKRRGYVKFK